MIADLIAVLFLSREYAHREHLRAQGEGSYARHKALEDFYKEIVELADTLTEMWQGRNSIITDVPYMNLDGQEGLDAASTMKELLSIVEQLRYQAVPKEDTALQNVIDEVVGLFLSTLYKLKYFR